MIFRLELYEEEKHMVKNEGSKYRLVNYVKYEIIMHIYEIP